MSIFALQTALPGLGVAPAHLAHLHDPFRGGEAQLSSTMNGPPPTDANKSGRALSRRSRKGKNEKNGTGEMNASRQTI